jgi:hypothetical protein
MRKILLAAALAMATVAPAMPANANHKAGAVHWEFTASVPCLVVCSYWIDNGFTPCEAPFPPGSYEDRVSAAAPNPGAGKLGLLTFEIFPVLDWDSFVCANDSARTQLGQGANAVGDPCDGILGPNDLSGTGCYESVTIPVTQGTTYRLRGYNWQDGPIACPASYHFKSV